MKWLKIGVVIFVAIAITALGIDAADTLQGSRSTLLGQIVSTETKVCPEGMIEVTVAQSFTCVDEYEASVGKGCPYASPTNELDSKANVDDVNCGALSKKDSTPWRYITREQAQTACLRSGKRLPKSSEWYLFSSGTPDASTACNIDSNGIRTTGASEACKSAVGVFDTIGNVWEWTADDVIEGVYEGRVLPETGYVKQVDTYGMAVITDDISSELFSKDYFWSSSEGAYGVIRGGFYGSKSDAGLYSVHADTPPTSAGTAIGFRCVR